MSLPLQSILSNFEESLAQQQVQDEENNNISSNTKDSPEEAEEGEKSASNADNTIRRMTLSFNSTTIDRNLAKYRSRSIRKKKKTNLKECHLCKLEYPTAKERTEHE